MAGKSLGVLTLDLVAKVGGFEQGLDRAARASAKSAKEIQAQMQAARASAVALGLGFTAAAGVIAAAFTAINAQAESIAVYQDLSDKIGDTASAISSLQLAADISGVSLETVGAASVKLTATLAKQDEESKGAAQGIKALGLEFEAFKKLSPVEQLDAVAKALAGFADGAEKTAVAVALFGKSGAELIPFLNDLAEDQERQARLTDAQILAADNFTKSIARLKSEFSQIGQELSGPVITGLDALIQRFRDGKKDGDGFLLTLLKQTEIARLLGVSGQSNRYTDVRKEIELIDARLKAGNVTESLRNSLLEKRGRLLAEQAKFLTGARLTSSTDPRSLGLPTLDISGLAPDEKKPTTKPADPEAEAKRYLESLQKQLEKTQDLTVVEQVLKDIQMGRLGLVTPEVEASLLLTARQIDAAKVLVEAEKAYTEEMKSRREAIAVEGDAVNKTNEAYQKRLELLLDNTPSAVLEKQRADVQLLTDEYLRFIRTSGEYGISEQQYLEGVTARLDLVGEKIKETKSFAEEFGLTFTSALEDAIVTGGKFSDMLKAVGQDILRLLVRDSITEPLFKSIKSGGVLDGIGSFFSSLFNFDGGGYTGSGPRTGGLDGKGGYMAMVHPQETIVDHTKGQGTSGSSPTFNFYGSHNRNELIAAVQTGRALAVNDISEARRRGRVS